MFDYIVDGDALPPSGEAGTFSSSGETNTSATSTGNQETSTHATAFSTNEFSLLECGNATVGATLSSGNTVTGSGSNTTSFTVGGSTVSVTNNYSFSSNAQINSFSYSEVNGFTTEVSSGSTVIVNASSSAGTSRVAVDSTGGATTLETTTSDATNTTNSTTFATTNTTSAVGAKNTTTEQVLTATITSYSTGTTETTVLTGTEITTNTSSTYWTTTTTETTVEVPFSSYTTTDEEGTITTFVTATITYTEKALTTEAVTFDGSEGCMDQDTIYEAGECMRLYTAGPSGGGIQAFCDVYASVLSFIRKHTWEPTSTTSGESGDSSASGYTSFSYLPVEQSTDGGYPQTFVGGFNVKVPSSPPGYQPYDSLAVSDDVYGSYTIDVATTLDTDSPEYSSRSAGTTFGRGPITQVLTLDSNDTLVMGTVVASTTGIGNGGYGYVSGDATVSFAVGVYDVTSVSSNGSSSSEQITVAATMTSEISPAGVVLGIYAVVAVSGTTGWENGVEKKTAVELDCDVL
jgi:hypothetical protein